MPSNLVIARWSEAGARIRSGLLEALEAAASARLYALGGLTDAFQRLPMDVPNSDGGRLTLPREWGRHPTNPIDELWTQLLPISYGRCLNRDSDLSFLD